jgi:hypothetical protein
MSTSEAAKIAEMFLSWPPQAREHFMKSLGEDHPWYPALREAHNRLEGTNNES